MFQQLFTTFVPLLLAASSFAAPQAIPADDPPALTTPAGVTFTQVELRRIQQHSPLPPPPPDPTNGVADHPGAVDLGRILFHETRLSSTATVSCATCHDPQKSFADGKAFAEGIAIGPRHTPSLWNVAHNRWYFWDGRADTLWSQALQPIEREIEMGGSRMRAATLIARDELLRDRYEKVFGRIPAELDSPGILERGVFDARPVPSHPQNPHHVEWLGLSTAQREAAETVFVHLGKSIAAFERTLISRDAPFDRFAEGLRTQDAGQLAAISAEAQRGLKLFVGKANCRLCHSGPNFTDGEFHDVRVAPLGSADILRALRSNELSQRDRIGKAAMLPPGANPDADAGRYAGIDLLLADPFNAAGRFSDDPRGERAEELEFIANAPEWFRQFKTPTLRHVATTAPYMHQGQFATLKDVLHHYSTFDGALPTGHHPETILIPLRLTEQELIDLEAFLHTLTGLDADAGVP